MSEHDSDIEFDFFDDARDGRESASIRIVPARSVLPGRRRSAHPSIARLPPAARLAGLIAFGILIIVLLVLWVQSCSGSSQKSSYENYLAKVRALGHDSTQLGTQLSHGDRDPGDRGLRSWRTRWTRSPRSSRATSAWRRS